MALKLAYFLSLGQTPVVPNPGRPRSSLDVVDLFIVVIFIIEFIYSSYASGQWRRYAKEHWYELPTLLPITGNMTVGIQGISLIRGLRLIRLIRLARLLRVVSAAARMRHFWSKAFRIARRVHLLGLLITAGLIVGAGAGLSWLFEAPTNPSFRGGHSIWWAVNMLSNVAYVDFQPKTLGGKVVAGILEFLGIAFIGLFTASLAAAMLTDQGASKDDSQQPPD